MPNRKFAESIALGQFGFVLGAAYLIPWFLFALRVLGLPSGGHARSLSREQEKPDTHLSTELSIFATELHRDLDQREVRGPSRTGLSRETKLAKLVTKSAIGSL